MEKSLEIGSAKLPAQNQNSPKSSVCTYFQIENKKSKLFFLNFFSEFFLKMFFVAYKYCDKFIYLFFRRTELFGGCFSTVQILIRGRLSSECDGDAPLVHGNRII
jgi:hypothetical protein